ncbi:MAG: hypothetical protein M1835_006837 [Candelina submexicana]|nr:MAG: hypothetical protein M1835_006837 [Candelina submexicana]
MSDHGPLQHTNPLSHDAAEQSTSTQVWLPRGPPHYDNLTNTAGALYSENGGRNQSFGQNNAETSVEVILDLPKSSSSDQAPERYICLWPACEVTCRRIYDLKRHVSRHIPRGTNAGYFCPVSGCRYAVDYNGWGIFFSTQIYCGKKSEALDERTRLITAFGQPRKDKVLEHVHKEHSVRQQLAFVGAARLIVLQDTDPQSLECLLAAIEPSFPATFKVYTTDVKVDFISEKSRNIRVDGKWSTYAIQKTFVNPDGTEIEGGQIPLNITTDSKGRTEAI